MSSDLEFPSVKAIARINSLERVSEDTRFFDCKFYPFTEPGVDPVFAVVGKCETIICRPIERGSNAIEVLRWFRDEDGDQNLNSCIWAQEPGSGDPLICVSGVKPAIKIWNVKTGELFRTLVGHGREVNDLTVSPLSPWIIASASGDQSVRLWSLEPKYEEQPCILVCAGEGHKEGLLTLAFHPTGKYLLTGGLDCIVNLWSIPGLPDAASGTDKPTTIHYPHFSTSAIHTDFVDCVIWYNDLILSKCANESRVVLWRIENFDSSASPPSPSSAPTTHEFRPTRSAFGGTYQRLLQFDAEDTTPFYMRFSLYVRHNRRPILAVGNVKSKVFFWDLQALEEQRDGRDANKEFKVPHTLQKGVARKIVKQRESSVVSTATTSTNTTSSNSNILPSSSHQFDSFVAPATGNPLGSPGPKSRKKYRVDDPFKLIVPHKIRVVPKVTFAARQVAWSVGGEWMVVVGDQGMIALFGR